MFFCCFASGVPVGDVWGDGSDCDLLTESTVSCEQLHGVQLCRAAQCLHAEQQSLCHCPCPYDVRKRLSNIDRKTHPAPLEKELRELLTHSFHYSAVFLMGPVVLFHEVFRWPIFSASCRIQGWEVKYRITWHGQTHLTQMWAAGGHPIPRELWQERAAEQPPLSMSKKRGAGGSLQ